MTVLHTPEIFMYNLQNFMALLAVVCGVMAILPVFFDIDSPLCRTVCRCTKRKSEDEGDKVASDTFEDEFAVAKHSIYQPDTVRPINDDESSQPLLFARFDHCSFLISQ